MKYKGYDIVKKQEVHTKEYSTLVENNLYVSKSIKKIKNIIDEQIENKEGR